jgi:hypothetical protein
MKKAKSHLFGVAFLKTQYFKNAEFVRFQNGSDGELFQNRSFLTQICLSYYHFFRCTVPKIP